MMNNYIQSGKPTCLELIQEYLENSGTIDRRIELLCKIKETPISSEEESEKIMALIGLIAGD